MLTKGPFTIEIINPKNRREVYPVIPNSAAQSAGTAHILIPTCSHYSIKIGFQPSQTVSHFEIKNAKVGDREIYIGTEDENGNGNFETDKEMKKEKEKKSKSTSLIFYPSDFVIKGFETGSKQSFFFISQTNAEKSDSKLVEAGANVNNIITLELLSRFEVKKPRIPSHDVYSAALGGFGGSSGDYRGYSQTRSGFSFGGGDPHYYGTTSGSSFSFGAAGAAGPAAGAAGPASGGQDRDRDRGGGRIPRPQLQPQSLQSIPVSSLRGGTTISGGQHIDHVKTQTTDSTFLSVGEVIRFVIQLTTDETDEQLYKVNFAYYNVKNLSKSIEEKSNLYNETKEKIHQSHKDEIEAAHVKYSLALKDHMEKYNAETSVILSQLKEAQDRLDKIRTPVKKAAVPEDYLMKFE